jgi:predicted nicotinamide N-methyase
MSTIAGMKLVASKKSRSLSPIQQRRNKLAAKIHEQWELCTARQAGTIYAPRRLRTLTNRHTGERTTVETVKRVKEWFWISESGKINLSVRYGSKTLELAKGKNAIELATGDELVSVLEKLKTAVLAGELDAQIEAASGALRAGFVK